MGWKRIVEAGNAGQWKEDGVHSSQQTDISLFGAKKSIVGQR